MLCQLVFVLAEGFNEAIHHAPSQARERLRLRHAVDGLEQLKERLRLSNRPIGVVPGYGSK